MSEHDLLSRAYQASQALRTGQSNGHVGADVAATQASARWAEPEPLPVEEQPAFPVHLLPGLEQEWVIAVATATQTPLALPAMMTDGAVAITVAKRVEVEIRPGWREPLNAYNLAALDSGNRKSAVAQAVEAPLKAVEREQTAGMAPEIARARAKRDVVEKRLERLKKAQASKAVNDLAFDGDIDSAITELLSAELAMPVAPRYLVDDITPEKLADLMGEHRERMGVLSAEGGIFQVIAGRYADGKADGLDLFLKAYSGDSLPIDRIGRPTKQLDAPALSLVLAPQPEVLRGLARYPGFRGRGLLARFAYAIPLSIVGRRTIAAAPIPDTLRQEYERLIRALLALPDPGHSGNSVNGFTPLTLTLSDEAAQRFIAFETWLEPQLDRETGALGDIQDWASKLAGTVARRAGRMHVVQHIQAGVNGQPSTLSSLEIDVATIDAAIQLAKTFFIPHAKTAFAMMSGDQTESRARRVLQVVRAWPEATITRRDVWRRLCRSFTAVEDLDRPLALLVEHGYLRLIQSENSGPGRKPSPSFGINPLCRAEKSADEGKSSSGDVDTSGLLIFTSHTPESVDGIDRIPHRSSSVNSVNGNQGYHHGDEHLSDGTFDAVYWTHAEAEEVEIIL